jgi:prophage tail gpP-like protein
VKPRDSIGDTHSVVRLELAGQNVSFVAVSYEIQIGIFDVPATWSISFGIPARAVAGALAVCPPRTAYDLYIDDALQMSGYIDDRAAGGDANSTTFNIKGRDRLSELFDRCVTSEKSYTGPTIAELTTELLDDVYGQREGYELQYNADVARRQITGDSDAKPTGGGGAGPGIKIALPTLDKGEQPDTLDGFIDAANAKKPKAHKTGRVISTHQLDDPDAQTLVVPKRALNEVNSRTYKTVAEFNAAIKFLRAEAKKLKAGGAGSGPPPKPTVTAKIGERYFDGVLKDELDRAGLFLWQFARAFVLSVPNVSQAPHARIERRTNGTNNSPITSWMFNDGTVGRFTSCTIHAKAGKGSSARVHKDGSATDLEMLSYGWIRPLAVEDSKSKTDEQSIALAQRKLAETRRKNWALEYTLSGHTTINDAGKRVVWACDTTVEVVDEVLGLTGTFYVESVVHRGGPDGRTTTLRLMRPGDAYFGEVG